MSVGLGKRERQILRLLRGSGVAASDLLFIASAASVNAKTLDVPVKSCPSVVVYKSVARAALSLERKGLVVSRMHKDRQVVNGRGDCKTPIRFKQIALYPEYLGDCCAGNT